MMRADLWPYLLAVATRVVGTCCQLGLSLILGRVYGAAVTGAFFVFLYWANVVGTASSLGMPQRVMFLAAKAASRGSFTESRLLLRNALAWVLLLGATLGLLFYVAALRLHFGRELTDARSAYVGAICAAGVLLAAIRTTAEASKAMGRPILGLAVEFVAVPATFVLLAGAIVALGRARPALMQPVTLYTVALSCSLFVAIKAVDPIAHGPLRWPGPAPVWGFWGIALLNVCFMAAPYSVLPMVAKAGEIGVFAIAHRIVALAGSLNVALASVIEPQFARLYADRSWRELTRALRRSQWYLAAFYSPVLFGCLFLGSWILEFFGPRFAEGTHVLAVLALGRMANAACGLVDRFLAMTERAVWEVGSGIFALGLFVALVLGWARERGPIGVAYAYACAFATRGLVSYAMCRAAARRARCGDE